MLSSQKLHHDFLSRLFTLKLQRGGGEGARNTDILERNAEYFIK